MAREPKPIEPFELVMIGTGERFTPAYVECDPYFGTMAYLASGLKKDGTPLKIGGGAARFSVVPDKTDALSTSQENYVRRDGCTHIYRQDTARVDEEREVKANALRAKRRRLQEELDAVSEALLDLYRVHSG